MGNDKEKVMVRSPITGSSNVVLQREIPSLHIIDGYKKELGIDVSGFFDSIGTVKVYTCLDTGYNFYYPLHLSGNSKFYEKLEKYPWYYMDWKWEHSVALARIQQNDQVLEIGCAHGVFLEKSRDKGAIVEGLEMNTLAIKDCIDQGLSVYADSIERFSIDRQDRYDVVCSFQVLEHVADVRSFLHACIRVLKPGGTLIIAVPNNDNFTLHSGEILLDMPPHHMGQWNINSLLKLQKHFDISVDAVHLEPLQKYHFGYARNLADNRLKDFPKIIRLMIRRFVHLGVNAVAGHILGHTMVGMFIKK